MVRYDKNAADQAGQPRRVLSVSAARRNLFQLVDRLLDEGGVVEIERHGRRVRLAPVEQPASRMQRLVRRSTVVGNPEDLVDLSVWDEAAWRNDRLT